jgi:asparagine synthase (glutamine-hydrolysing)
MCGIAGLYNPEGINISLVSKISKILKHRGPDDEGYLFVDINDQISSLKGDGTIKELSSLNSVDEINGGVKLALIHRRLSIIDLSSTGHQPMTYSGSQSWIVFNGEIYNYLELRQELINLGYSFKSESDTEVILASYAEWSESCVSHFSGMWSFVIFDSIKNILFCSRDRFGIKPLYFVNKGKTFAFSSEIKALLSIPEILPELEIENAIEFIINGNQYFKDKTFFRNIHQIEPGNNLIFHLNENRFYSYCYYKLNINNDFLKIDLDEAVLEFNRLIINSMKIHLRSDVPIGTCLSGGIDSSTIVALLSKQNLPYKLKTFTASFPGSSIDETSFIKKVKELYDFSDNYTYPDPHELWENVDLFLWHQDLPVQNTSPFAQWKVMSLAQSNSVKVLLDGQGMDEILGGYSEFVGAFLLGQLINKQFFRFIRSFRDLSINYKTSSVSNELFRALFHLFPNSIKSRIYSSQRIGPSMVNKKYKEISDKIFFDKRIGNSVQETSINSINNILPVLLRYEDRNSMAFSIESRVPYLDHRLVEFCVNLPENIKIYDGWTKYIFRKSSENLLPADIIWRKEKLGFVTPERQWIDVLIKELQSLNKQQNIPEIINVNYFNKLLNSSLDNKINIGEIWKVILFIRWMNVFNVSCE